VGAVDVLRYQLSVSAQLGRDGELGPPKSKAGRRTLAVPAWLVAELAALMNRRSLTAADGESLLFDGGSGTPLHCTNWRRRAWAPACETAGLPGLRSHDLRSLAITALIAQGFDVKTAQASTRCLSPPRHASPVTAGCEARGKSLRTVVPSDGYRRGEGRTGEPT
jgi:hypothetical protein